MGRAPSIETQLRAALRELRAYKREADQYADELRKTRLSRDAIAAERDEWKRRFDILLSRDSNG